jgi:hypothetical protein
MANLFELIEVSGLKASDVVKMTHGQVSLNLASQWLNAPANGRKLSMTTVALLRCLCEKKLTNGTLAKEIYELDRLYLQTVAAPPRICGVYFLFDGLELVYVGQSLNLHRRVISHVEQGVKKFDRFSFLVCPPSDKFPLEHLYISKFKPKYNMLEMRYKEPRLPSMDE